MVPKIPDGAVSDSVSLERRDEYTVSAPADYVNKDYKTWDLVTLQLPFLVNSLFLIAGAPEDIGKWSDKLSQLIDQINVGSLTPPMFPTWHQIGVEPGGVFFSICGSQVLDPQIKTFTPKDDSGFIVPTNSTQLEQFFKSARRVALGITADLDANSLTDKGRLTSGQFPTKAIPKTYSTSGTDESGIHFVDNVYNVNELTFPPVLEQGITTQDLKSRQAEAREGDYSPARMWQPVVEFVPAASFKPMTFELDSSEHPGPFLQPVLTSNLCFDGWGSQVCHWQGIDVSSSVHILRKEVLELITGVNSTFGPFSTPAYARDEKALAVVSEFCRTQPHSFCADMNHKNGLLGSIVGGLGNALGNLGIPIISDIGNIAGDLISGILPF